MPQNRSPLWLLIIVGFLLYLPTLLNGFVWDDEELILNNPQVRSLENLPAFFSGSTFNSGGGANLAGLYYKPLMTTAFAVIYQIAGPNAFPFHLFQIMVHISNAVLVYLILLYLFSRFKLDSSLAFVAALVFLIHPINAEAVVYLADYQEVMFFFFGALALLLIMTKKNIFWPTLIFLFSLLSKETGIIFAAISAAYLLLFDRSKIKTFIASGIIVLLIYSFLRFGVAQIFFNKHGLTEITTMSLPERLINIPEIIFTYLKNFFFPTNLAINQQWVVKNVNFSLLAVDLLFFILLIRQRSKAHFKLWLFFFIWFILGLAFHLQIFPLDLTVSDRWFYLPIVGLLAMLVMTVRLNLVLVLFLLFLLAGRTWVREFDWRDGLTLYSHDITISKNAFDLENNLGVELFRVGRINEAKAHFEASIKLSPRWWTNWNNLGAVYEREGDLVKAQQDYRRSIDNGQYYLAYENYAKILYRQGKKEEARTFLGKEALPKLPYNQTLLQLQYLLYNDLK